MEKRGGGGEEEGEKKSDRLALTVQTFNLDIFQDSIPLYYQQ